MKRFASGVLLVLLGMAVAAIGFGCSGENPENLLGSPNSIAVAEDDGGSVTRVLLADQIQFASRVASIDPGEMKLTFTGVSYIAVAAEDCEIVVIIKGEVTPMPFDAIIVGDSVQICGDLQANETVLAKKVRIYGTTDCPDYDVIFWDTITTIDYAAGSFTVASQTQIIVVDDNTVIWGRIPSSSALSTGDGDGEGDQENPWIKDQSVIYEFTDLAVGFVVEVHAKEIDSETLLAVSIKIANCSFKKCLEYSGYLATVDVDARLVTLDGLTWIGTVCPLAALTDADSSPLTLGDFNPGDYVTVKGFPEEGDTFYICAMEKTEL